jgi:hypothetical protein
VKIERERRVKIEFTKRGDTGRKAGKVQSKLRKKADKLKKWGEVTQND